MDPCIITAEAIARRASSRAFAGPALVKAAFALLLIAALANDVLAGETAVALMGNHPVADFTNFGPADKDRRLDLEIIFALRNKPALDELLAAQQDPNSPDYRHWLTPNEFTAKFGPNSSDVRAVAEWLESQRFTAITADSQDRSIRFNSTVSDAERVFGVAIVASANGVIYGNTSDPLIPARFAGVIARIEGLDNMRAVVPLSPASRPGVVAAPSP